MGALNVKVPFGLWKTKPKNFPTQSINTIITSCNLHISNNRSNSVILLSSKFKVINMGVTTFTEEYATPVAAARMFKALIADAHNIIPKLMPQSIKNIELLEGDGGAGSIRKTIFSEGSHLTFLKHRIDSLDLQNLTCKYTLIEGDILDDKLESISYLVKFEPSGNGGCVIKTTCEYHTKGDIKLKEEDIKAGKDNAGGLSKVVEDYLLKNPTAYA